MKKNKIKNVILIWIVIVAALALNGCSNQPSSINSWKAWVLTRAKVEDYTPIDLVSNFVDERMGTAQCVDYLERYENWWDNGEGEWPKEYEDVWISASDRMFEMESERKDFKGYYYPTLAKLTLINALCSHDKNSDDDGIAESLALSYLKLMGDEYILLAFLEAVDEVMDLNNLEKLSQTDLKQSMVEVIDENGFSLYKTMLKTDENNDEKWWGADNVSRLALEFEDEFFENVILLLGDFSELKQAIDDAVSVYNCEYNSELSSGKADVYDVIYSIKDKMYVKCTILESEGKSEIKINNKSTHLLSL